MEPARCEGQAVKPHTVAFVAYGGTIREMDVGAAINLGQAARASRDAGDWRPDPIFVRVSKQGCEVPLARWDGSTRVVRLATQQARKVAEAQAWVMAVQAIACFGAFCGGHETHQIARSIGDLDAWWQALQVRRRGPPLA